MVFWTADTSPAATGDSGTHGDMTYVLKQSVFTPHLSLYAPDEYLDDRLMLLPPANALQRKEVHSNASNIAASADESMGTITMTMCESTT